MNNRYQCIATPDSFLILQAGERQLSITPEEESKLLAILSRTERGEQWNVAYSWISRWVKAGTEDERAYFARVYTNEFLDLHGIDSDYKSVYSSNTGQNSHSKKGRRSAKKGLLDTVKGYTAASPFLYLLLFLAGGSGLLLLSDAIFKWLPSLDINVFFEILVALTGCACFALGIGLIGFCIVILSNLNRNQ